MTKDSVFVLQHDPTIDRCSNGAGRVNDMTYDFGADYIITEVPLDEATTTNIHQICV